jgi:hypothetical protein
MGGRPRADDRGCLEGILWVLRTGARWGDLPSRYPSPATWWRRLAEWQRQDVWLTLWRAFLSELDGRGQLDWSEAFLDATFAPAKKGAPASASHARVRAQSSGHWSTARVFLSECTFRLPTGGSPPRRADARPRGGPARRAGATGAQARAPDRRPGLRQPRLVAAPRAPGSHAGAPTQPTLRLPVTPVPLHRANSAITASDRGFSPPADANACYVAGGYKPGT